MTAVPEWDIVDQSATDAELVHGSMAGDPAAFAQIYDRYADRLHDFCVGMLRDLDAAADCVQDTFCVAATRMHQLRDPDRLRPWLYSVARNEALRRLRERRRETPTEELPDVESDDAGPDTLTARAELADLIAEAAGGLSDRDRAVLDLAYRHGLDGPDLAEALGVSHGNANTMVVRLRRTIERSLGALLVSRRAQKNADACPELREILAQWDGQFTVLMRKRISRHIESCAVCDEDRRRLVSPTALLGAAPLMIPAPKWLRDKTMRDVQLVSHNSALETTADGVAPGHLGSEYADGERVTRDRRRRLMVAALLIAELGAGTALLLAYLNSTPTPITPTEVSETAPPAPTGTPSPPLPPPAPAQPPPEVAKPAPAPQSGPTPELIPTILPPPPAPEEEAPAADEAPATPAAPSTKPPMSFSPTAVVTPAAPPESGGDGGGGRRAGAGGP